MQPRSDVVAGDMPDAVEPGVQGENKDAKTAMIEVAEKLIGERGLDNVSMRDVAAMAGHRNNSAVQYHFGSRDGLITQILRRRLVALDVERKRRLAEVDEQGLGTDLTSLVHVLFGPMVDLLRAQPEATHYARFLQRVGPVMGPAVPEVNLRTTTDDVVVRLIDVLSHLPRRTAFERIDLATQMFTGSLAVYEDRRDANNTVVNSHFDSVLAHLYDMVEAALRAGVGMGEPRSEVADTPEPEVGGG
ncbi:TetR/AcrR family transcriptional regulator [Dietzia aurantiaca]|uniref:TetR/AcrR family transcriptional regulator n=1 Tax=Dietzia aurantiaca TaxID=983873 RepID=UPI001E58DA8B|nr:TetR family transcriptional regulator [Dietzia aurantiaca]